MWLSPLAWGIVFSLVLVIAIAFSHITTGSREEELDLIILNDVFDTAMRTVPGRFSEWPYCANYRSTTSKGTEGSNISMVMRTMHYHLKSKRSGAKK